MASVWNVHELSSMTFFYGRSEYQKSLHLSCLIIAGVLKTGDGIFRTAMSLRSSFSEHGKGLQFVCLCVCNWRLPTEWVEPEHCACCIQGLKGWKKGRKRIRQGHSVTCLACSSLWFWAWVQPHYAIPLRFKLHSKPLFLPLSFLS